MAISEGKHGNFGGQSRKEGEGSGFAAGVVILTLSGLLVKLFGLFYKIPLVALLGDSGMGYFNSAYTIYTFFYTLSTAGLPVALSILVSGRRAKGEFGAAERLLRNGMLAFSLARSCRKPCFVPVCAVFCLLYRQSRRGALYYGGFTGAAAFLYVQRPAGVFSGV